MKPLVKLCGITNLQDALFCASSGVDFLGFIFYKKSPRYIEPSNARMIIGNLPPNVTPVGIFVNEARKAIEEIIRTTGIRVVQLSGNERPDECERYPVDVWKSFRIRREEEIPAARDYHVAACMLEGATGDRYGGSGEVPDLSIAVKLKQFHPLILAGGLNPQNVTAAIQCTAPYAIDVNSGVELAAGKKDHAKVRLLFEKLSMLT